MTAKTKAPAAPAAATDNVECKVVKAGDGKIFTGETVANPNDDEGEERFPTYKKGDTFITSAKQGAILEDRGLVDVLGPAEAGDAAQ